jgi:PH and SEC7 domain-containing protein
LSNWERKSKHLLSEIVKYQSYIDSLHNAMALRLKKRGEKALERALVGADPDDDEPQWNSQHDDETVQDHGRIRVKEKRESDLITPTVTLTGLHRRGLAEVGENSDSDG